MDGKVYTISELLQLNETSTPNEFKPVMGNGVKRGGNQSEKAVKDIIKQVKDFNDVEGIESKRVSKVPFEDYNKTTMDVNFEYEPDKKWKERVKKLATVGTESEMSDAYETEGAEEFYKTRQEMSKNRREREENERIKGIVGRNNDDHKAKDYKTHGAFINESKPLKRLKFKNTVFLSESQVLSRVPEEYKIDENRFYMQDKTGTDYLIECRMDPFGMIHVSIENKINKQNINEQLQRINELANYKHSDTNCKINTQQGSDVSVNLNNIRKMLKNN